MLKRISLISLLVVLLFTSCVPPIKITQDYQASDFVFGSLANKKLCITSTTIKNGQGFERSIRREYQNNENYISNIVGQVDRSFTAQNVLPANYNVSEEDISTILGNSTDNSVKSKILNKVNTESEANFLLLLSSVSVVQEVTHTAGTMTTGANGAMTNTGGSSQSKCIVKINAELWDLTKEKVVLEFTAHGEDVVTFFATDAALRNATAEAVANLSNYITTGTI